ncbi:MAG: hypothetical protein DSY43_00365 [Gammaproteobacteria bacterium]|nr:MAG: hypothetical protein DSY43_00365 [Gammaproteobacteria bacterium]
MSKFNLLTVLLVSSLLSACGFHTPTNTISINVSITGNSNGAFATEFKKHLSAKAERTLTVKIGDEVQKQQAIAYTKGVASSYTLILSVPVEISRGKKILLSKKLTASTTVSDITTSQADRLHIGDSYMQLRKALVVKLLRRLNALK